MLSSKKSELEAIKKRYAQSIRQESKALKLRKAEESSLLRDSKQQELKRLTDLEAEFTLAKEQRELTRRSSLTSVSNRSKEYLDHVNQLHDKAKLMLKRKSLMDNFPSPPPLVESSITTVNKTVDHIRVPILVPQSILRKSLKAKPPMYNHVLKSGEVVSVHLLTESMPTFDPLVRAEAKIPKKSLGANASVLADISYSDTERGRVMKSLSPVKHKRSSLDLSPPQGLHAIREYTPREKVERYNYRECEYSDSTTNESNRSWVSQRMKMYAQRIKIACKPQVSGRKRLEMDLIKEKLKRNEKQKIARVHLSEIL